MAGRYKLQSAPAARGPMALVRPGGFGGEDLYSLGAAFRSEVRSLTFDQFEVEFDMFKRHQV